MTTTQPFWCVECGRWTPHQLVREVELESGLVRQVWECCECGRVIAIHVKHVKHIKPEEVVK